MMGWGLGASADRSAKLPYPAFMVIIDPQSNSQYSVDFSKVRFCGGYPPDSSIADFDPRKLSGEIGAPLVIDSAPEHKN